MIQPSEITGHVEKQLDALFPGNTNQANVSDLVDRVMPEIEYCFDHINAKYYFNGFDRYNADHSVHLLYRLSRAAYRDGNTELATRFYLLNRALNGIDIFYEVELPRIVFFSHAVGTVLGRAKYGDYLYVSQGCTVGGNRGGYPTLGRYVTLYPRSMVLGSSILGHNSSIAAGGVCIGDDVLPGEIYYGNPKLHWIKDNTGINHVWKCRDGDE